jgi:hypothetical protein
MPSSNPVLKSLQIVSGSGATVGVNENIVNLYRSVAGTYTFQPDTSWGSDSREVRHAVKSILSGDTRLLNNTNLRNISVQVFTSNGTVTLSGGLSTLWVMMFSGGSGGRGGTCSVSGVAVGAATGGNAGGFAQYIIPIGAESTYNVTVGAGGVGGAGRSTAGTGATGGTGGTSSVGTARYRATSVSGNSTVLLPSINTAAGAQPGSLVTTGSHSLELLSSTFFKALGGCSGGALTAADEIIAPGLLQMNSETMLTMTGSSNPGSDGPSAPSGVPIGGWGGNGGSASASSNGQNGGNGGLYGGGGGGGGATRVGFTSGNGGNGADGIVVVIVF